MAQTGCISDPDLRAFLLGELPDPLADAIARHLELCPDCETRASRCDDFADTAIQALRRAAPERPETPVRTNDPATVAPAPCLEENLPLQLGRYRLEGEIARGGMGLVLRAHDTAFQRTLAVKLLLDAHQERPDLKQRFLEEAQVLGQLQHPGIPPVHDKGELPDGRPFFAMKLIEGCTLADLLQERPTPAHELPRFLAVFGQLCQAVAYAHSRGILHRDLKPGNVMVGAFGEVQVMDWGLAKVLASGGCQPPDTGGYRGVDTPRSPERPQEQTQEGAVLGTLAYMAPEQARGEVAQVDERADVFGLGAVLCVILTGAPPYVASGKPDLYQQAAQGALADAYARLDRCGADGELVTLAKRCLAPDAPERPRHAGEVAEAVAAYQAKVQERLRQAELARAEAQIKVREERKRRRLTLALAAAVLLLVGIAGAAGWWYQHRQTEEALRREQAAGEVLAALGKAAQLRLHALTLLDNPESWGTTLAAADSAVARAETLLQQQPQLAETALQQEIRQNRTALEADQKDHRLVTDFERALFKLYDFDPNYTQTEVYQDVERALEQWGLPVGKLPVTRATALLQERPRGIQDRLAAILHFCLASARDAQKKQKSWLQEVLTAADPDPWRQQVRQALVREDPLALEKLLGEADVARQPPAFLVEVARSRLVKDKPGKIALLRRAQEVHPEGFWLNWELSQALRQSLFPSATAYVKAEDMPRVHEVIRFRTAALALRPKNPAVHHNLGLALLNKGDLEGAIAGHQKAIALDPRLALSHDGLGLALLARNDLARAMVSFEKALALDPKLSQSYTGLGRAWKARGDVAKAIACYEKALELKPENPLACFYLGVACLDKKDLARAIACFQKARDLDPKFADAHHNLGSALYEKNDLKGAIICLQKALELDPKHARAHDTLGQVLSKQGDLTGAIAHFRKAVDLDPKDVRSLYNLATLLWQTGDLAGAVAGFNKVLELAPTLAEAHCNLGHALRDQGHFAEALAALKRGHQIGSRRPGWPYPSPQWVDECQRLLELDTRLTALLVGEDQPRDAAERLALADFCQRYKKRYTAAARLCADAVAAGATLTPKEGYGAACCAVRAAAGQGTDAAILDPKERSRLRRQALTWLRDALKIHTQRLEDADAQGRAALEQELQLWQQAVALDRVRGAKPLAQLPEAERPAWQQFWADVEKLLKKGAP
jgi:serine/threonine-protein kinase